MAHAWGHPTPRSRTSLHPKIPNMPARSLSVPQAEQTEKPSQDVFWAISRWSLQARGSLHSYFLSLTGDPTLCAHTSLSAARGFSKMRSNHQGPCWVRLGEIGSQLPGDIRQLSTQDIGLGYCISLPGVSPRAISFSVRDLEHIISLSFYFLICKTGMMTIRIFLFGLCQCALATRGREDLHPHRASKHPRDGDAVRTGWKSTIKGIKTT